MKLRNEKTGDIVEYDKVVYRKLIKDGYEDFIPNDNEEWEDYKPAEPLIKDEKIRKAVRAWAEASDIGVVRVIDDYCFKDSESDACIRFYDKIGVYLECNYTITELCGEEEE